MSASVPASQLLPGRPWLMPPEKMRELELAFGSFDFDPCPNPRPDGFDGLRGPWGVNTYVNPLFSPTTDGEKDSLRAWVAKACEERARGRASLLVFPVDTWTRDAILSGARPLYLGRVRWLDTVTREPAGSSSCRPIMAWRFEPGQQGAPWGARPERKLDAFEGVGR